MDYFGSVGKGIEYLKKIEPDIIIAIKKVKDKRNVPQNRLYWKYLEIIGDDTGNDAQELHEFFKRKFLPPIFSQVIIKGKKIEYKRPASTARLDKIQFTNYLDKIASLTDIPIPNSEQYDRSITKI